MPTARATARALALAPSLELPRLSFGPFRLLEAVPWLMLATAVRFVVYGKTALMAPALVVESVAIFLAFLLAARRMIEFTDGRTELGKLSFLQQLSMAKRVLFDVALLMVGVSIAMSLVAPPRIASAMLLGFDGIAFDQFVKAGMVWSSLLAAIVLLMVVKVGTDLPISLWGALKEMLARSACLLPAIVAVAAMQFGLSAAQGMVRGWVYVFWQTSPSPQQLKNLVYFVFVFGFASLRLWLTLAILTFALRESYRRNEA